MSITLVSLAEEARRHFTLKTRITDSEHDTKFWSHDVDSADEKNAWIYDMTCAAHTGILPDDYKYQFVVDALELIIDNEPDDVDDAQDIEIEPDTYTSDLLKWLSSSNARLAYCDEAAHDFGDTGNLNTLGRIEVGQVLERREVFNSVLDSLSAELEAREEMEEEV